MKGKLQEGMKSEAAGLRKKIEKNNAEGFGIRESRPGHHVIYHAEEASQKASQMVQMYLGGRRSRYIRRIRVLMSCGRSGSNTL